MWYVGCKHGEQETPALLWSGEHVGPGRARHEAVLVTDSNEASPELERCQFSTGLRGKIQNIVTKQERNHHHAVYVAIECMNS